jgi:hypothetical protein
MRPPTAAASRRRPPGPLHDGSLVAALASWLDAARIGGRWLVRIEDVDRRAAHPGSDRVILDQLQRCGLVPDEPPVWQSAREDRYARRWTGWWRRPGLPLRLHAQGHRRRLAAQGRPHARTASGSTRAPAAGLRASRRAPGGCAATTARRAGASTGATAAGRAAAGRDARGRRLRAAPRRRASGPTSWRWWSTTPTRASPTSCAARTWPTTRRGRSCCSARWACRRRLPAHAAGAGRRRPQAQQAERRGRAGPADPLPRCGAPARCWACRTCRRTVGDWLAEAVRAWPWAPVA